VRQSDGRSEKDKMLEGDWYRAVGPELAADEARADRLLRAFNASGVEETARRDAILTELFGAVGEGVVVRPPFYCDYGYNIRIGCGSFVNFGAVFLDVAPIVIGEDCQIGPSVQIYAADHPRDPGLRRERCERAVPVSIGNNVWLGGGAILLPGIRIGDNAIVGAGSVVTRDVPPGVTVAGNPARILRRRQSSL
jgi:maltose O-acetyltransferase